VTQYILQPVSPASPVVENIQQIVRAGAGPSVIINRDLLQTITIAHSLGPQIPDVLNLGNYQTSDITPQSSITVTGEDDVWGVNLNTSAVTVDVHSQSLSATIPAQGVPGSDTGDQILQSPGIYTMYTFASQGRIWAAEVSYSMGSSGGNGSNQGYCRVFISGTNNTLCVVECCVVGNPDSDSNSNASDFPGFLVAAGTKVKLDVNNNVAINGIVQRGSGVVSVSIP
jgi:hypothetical protein